MLYVFWGSDTAAAHAKAIDTLNSLRKKAPDAAVIRLSGEEVSFVSIEEALKEQGLFKTEVVLLLDLREAGAEAGVESATLCASSSHVVLAVCGALTQKEQKSFEQHAKKMQQFEVKEKKPAPTLFHVADSLYAKDTKRMIIDIEKTRLRGIPSEELIGILFWAAKCMVLADNAATPTGAGLKPFVFQKAKKGATHWGSDEARALVTTLAHIPHEARRKGVDPYTLLEHFFLKL